MAWASGATPPGTIAGQIKRLKHPKDPTDVTPVAVDFRGALAVIEGDVILTNQPPSAAVTRNDDSTADLVVIPPVLVNDDQTRCTVWCAEGSAGYEYLVSITVQTEAGQELTRSFIFPVARR